VTPGFARLAVEALRDALRRRVVLVVGLFCLLALPAVRSCAQEATFLVQGQVLDPGKTGVLIGIVLMLTLAMAVVTLAGILAADELARPLDEGSALLWLARPVGRASYALARLSGAVGVAWGAGALLLGTALFGLAARRGLPLGPGLLAAGACAGGAVVVGALAMTASLVLPRIAVAALVVLGLALVSVAELLAVAHAQPSDLLALVGHYGPPLVTAPLHALLGWTSQPPAPQETFALFARLGVWLAASPALLVLVFRRRELG
jgi:hypothetical protein